MVSVIVIGRNEGERLTACLGSIRASMGPLKYELLYIDSRSKDDSIRRALDCGARVFRLTEPETTAGLGRLVGSRLARGEWLLFLDGDMQLCPGFVEKALSLAFRKDCSGVCGIRKDEFIRDGKCVSSVDNVFSCTEERICPEFGGALFVSAAALSACGGWSAEPVACEEAELHARLLAAGCKIAEIPVPMIVHTDTVRERRSLLGVLFSRRRLGDGQALRSAAAKHSAKAYLSFERRKFAFGALDLLCAFALFAGGPGLALISLLQCFQLGFFASRRQLRAFVSQKLFFFAFIPGLLTWRRKDEGFEEVSA